MSAFFRNYARFSGRASRSEYWLFVLAMVIVSIVAGIADALLLGGTDGPNMKVISALTSLFFVVPSLSYGARRLHDTNRSGWWLLLALIPLLGSLALFVFFVLRGTEGDNRFGPDPLASAGTMETAPST